MKFFKAGDRVRRIKGYHCGMGIGDTDIVKKDNHGKCGVILEKFNDFNNTVSHDENNLEIINDEIVNDYEIF